MGQTAFLFKLNLYFYRDYKPVKFCDCILQACDAILLTKPVHKLTLRHINTSWSTQTASVWVSTLGPHFAMMTHKNRLKLKALTANAVNTGNQGGWREKNNVQEHS